MKSFRSAIVRFGMAMLTVSCLLASWAITVPLAPAQENKASAPAQTPPPGKKSQVDVNSADLKTLQTLPGIGPVLAQRIIDGRPYKTLADVAKVKGLSPAKLDAIKDTLTFGSAATLATQTAKPAKPAKSVTAAAVSEPQAPATPAAAQPAGVNKNQSALSTSAAPASGSLTVGQKLNINKATAEELDRLPGIGPAKAKAIIDYRNQNGDFKTIEDIQKVKGIKAGVFSKITDLIQVTD